MPLARYFLFVGGTLLALLFVFDAYMPSPVVARAPVETIDRPVVRIHSAQKLPERIVIDTSIATIVPPVVVAEVTAKPQQPQKPQVLDALAQVTPSDIKKSDLKKPEPALPPKHKVARRQVHQPMVASAQQPPRFAFAQGPRFDFDFFGRN
jgi:hypothetical protein